MNSTVNSKLAPKALAIAKQVLQIEAQAVSDLIARLDQNFVNAVEAILQRKGRVIVSGIGKSGHIARKIASTLASTGTPAYFVHPAEASHGDLGMITRDDILIAISNSGETPELMNIIPLVKRQGGKLIAMTGNAKSTLSLQADIHLDSAVAEEACPLGLAPTASTTAALALGDALALALLDARGFGPDDFARSHPGGNLGRMLLTRVKDVMRTGAEIPQVLETAKIAEVIPEMTSKKMGMTAILDQNRKLVGIFTDGDLRRNLNKIIDARDLMIKDIMTPQPRTIHGEHLAVEAVKIMEQFKVNQMLVVDNDKKLIGVLNMHDLFRAKVI
jgi:arabinose-5-phosphate isomerase